MRENTVTATMLELVGQSKSLISLPHIMARAQTVKTAKNPKVKKNANPVFRELPFS